MVTCSGIFIVVLPFKESMFVLQMSSVHDKFAFVMGQFGMRLSSTYLMQLFVLGVPVIHWRHIASEYSLTVYLYLFLSTVLIKI